MYKYKKIKKYLWNLVVTTPRNKWLNLELLWRLNYSSKGNCLRTAFTETKLQIDRNLISKSGEARKSKYIFEKYFQKQR